LFWLVVLALGVPGLARAAEPEVRVVTSGEAGGVLLAADARGRFSPVCAFPCDIHLPPGTQLRIEGAGNRPSSTFALEPASRVTLAYSPQRTSTFVTGLVLSGIGVGLSLGLPAAVLIADASVGGSWGEGGRETDVSWVGYVALVGLGFLAVGLPTALTSLRSDVKQISAAPVAREHGHTPTASFRQLGFECTAWAGREAFPALAVPFVFPLVRQTF